MVASVPLHSPAGTGLLLHALPATSTTVVRRRFALPAVLMGVSGLAVTALAVLPPVTGDDDVLMVRAASPSAALLLPPSPDPKPVRTMAARPVVKKPVVKPKAKPRVVKRAARSKRSVIADFGDGYFCPVAGPRHFSDTWGDSRSGGRHHQGTDIMAARGTPIVAVIAGTIKTAYSSAGGISLYLRGVDGDEYFYAHNSRNVVSTGEHVKAGEVIAYVGSTGNAPESAPHLHFERHPNGGSAVNPYSFVVRACR
jgi:murein DD-endopeptidase MepM/ murein hydrolase activator NlpD